MSCVASLSLSLSGEKLHPLAGRQNSTENAGNFASSPPQRPFAKIRWKMRATWLLVHITGRPPQNTRPTSNFRFFSQ
eukprot:g60160.t1